MRFIYTICVYLYSLGIRAVAPFNEKAALWVLGRKNWQKNLKMLLQNRKKALLWFHAASLGEFEQGRPLIEAYRANYPEYEILLSFFSPSGYQVRKNYKDVDYVVYLPIDTQKNARDFLDIVHPKAVFFIKYEFWFNYMAEIKKRAIPLLMVSVKFRSHQYFFQSYGIWFLKQLKNVHTFFVQDALSQVILKMKGFDNVSLCGDTRFDRVLSLPNTRKKFDYLEEYRQNAFVLVAGSTWPKDEELIFSWLKKQNKEVKLILVPHEINKEHIHKIQHLYRDYTSLLWTDWEAQGFQQEISMATRVLIIDTIGLLSSLYAYADIVYIGGGFGRGIHNILEAAVYGKLIFWGPKYKKFGEAIALAQSGGGIPISKAKDLEENIDYLRANKEIWEEKALSSAEFVYRGRGAVKTILTALKPLLVCLFFFLSSAIDLRASETDSLVKEEAGSRRSGIVYSYREKPLQAGIPKLKRKDTLLDRAQIYNPVYAEGKFRANRGGLGMPTQSIEFGSIKRNGFRYALNPMESWWYSYENTEFFQSQHPYTDLYFITDFGKLNTIEVNHAQNLARGFNLGLDFKSMLSRGQYENSASRNTDFRFHGNYFSKDARYRAMFSYIRNRSDIAENGGILADSLFTQNEENNRVRIPVALNKAGNYLRENAVYLKHSYHFHDRKRDSIPENDFSYGYLVHTMTFSGLRAMYRDDVRNNPDYYENFYLDSLISKDTTRVNFMTNTLFWTSADFEKISPKTSFKFMVGGRNEFVGIRNKIREYSFLQWTPMAALRFQLGRSLLVDGRYEYTMGGYNANDYKAEIDLSYLISPREEDDLASLDKINLHASLNNYSADWILKEHFSNRFYWYHAWEKIKQYKVEFAIDIQGWKLNMSYYRMEDYVYLNKEGPRQADQPFNVYKASLQKNFRFGWFAWNNELLYQRTDKPEYIHLPEFCLKESVFGNIQIKKIALLQIGFDVFYNTSYYADAYMPSMTMYYWQDEVKTGNFVWADFFINCKIKRGDIFLKVENIGQAWMTPYNYISTPHYPLNDIAFRLGVKWRFYD